MTKFKSSLFLQLLCLILLLLWGLLLADTRCRQRQDEPMQQPQESSSKQVKKQQAILAIRYEDKINWLEKHRDSLQRQLKIQQQQMLLYKQQVLLQKFKVQQRITRQASQRDTLQKLLDCDSLREEVQGYIALAEAQDSLCIAQVQNLNEQIASRDSAQQTCTAYANQLNLLLDISTDAQQQSQKQLISLDKKIKSSKRINRMLGAGLLILSGLVFTCMTP